MTFFMSVAHKVSYISFVNNSSTQAAMTPYKLQQLLTVGGCR
jgi:hypothetical protein